MALAQTGAVRGGLAVRGRTLVALQLDRLCLQEAFDSPERRSVQEKLKQVASTRVGTLAVRCSHSRRVPGPPGWGVAPMVRRSRRATYDVCLPPAIRGGLVGRSLY